MSSAAQVAVLAGGRRPARRHASRHAERPLLRTAAFAALALYGVLRWATLLAPAPGWRLAGLLVLAVAVAAVGTALGDRARVAAVPVIVVALFAILALAGIPVPWLTHLRFAVGARAIGSGLSALPGALLPYLGINEWVRMVILLGAGVLLVDAALLLGFAPRAFGDLRRATAALPLVALAIVPSTLVRPHLPYVHGLVLFGLLAAFMWCERTGGRDAVAVVVLAGLAGGAAMVAAPALDQHKPWVDYQALAGGLSPANVESFDWTQRYGPLNWPRTGTEVLDVKATRPDYWKAENLDLFDGTSWIQGIVASAGRVPQPSPAAVTQWTQTLQVTIRAMRTPDVIGAGESAPPVDLAEGAFRGMSAGTWVAGSDMVTGDSYLITSYSPHPSGAQLSAARNDYSDPNLGGYRSIALPLTPIANVPPQIVFAPFHSGLPPESAIPIFAASGTVLIDSSPYGRMFALAQRLADRAPTASAFATSIERYLARGFRYDENPPPSPYPLASFVFKDKVGYCQQFAGAMALLLRMGGVPARVATGFTTGSYDNATHTWVVTDQDAHAWVEAWFGGYGWVRFDPTPAAAPAHGGRTPLRALSVTRRGAAATPHTARRDVSPPAAASRTARRGGGGGAALPIGVLALVLMLVVLGLLLTRRVAEPTGDALLAELERALARSGRPIAAGVTLAELEHRFRSSSEAAAYVRAIRLVRFAEATESPTRAQRRALRLELRAGLGLVGLIRSLWALPPNWSAPHWLRPSRKWSHPQVH